MKKSNIYFIVALILCCLIALIMLDEGRPEAIIFFENGDWFIITVKKEKILSTESLEQEWLIRAMNGLLVTDLPGGNFPVMKESLKDFLSQYKRVAFPKDIDPLCKKGILEAAASVEVAGTKIEFQ